jgi:hypothetical protein
MKGSIWVGSNDHVPITSTALKLLAVVTLCAGSDGMVKGTR